MNEMASQETLSPSAIDLPSTSFSISVLHPGYFGLRHFSSVLEGYRRKLAAERKQKTHRLKINFIAFLAAALLIMAIKILDLFYHIEFVYVFINILPTRTTAFILLSIGLYLAHKYFKENRRLLTNEETEWNAIGKAMLKAIDSIHKIKKEKDPQNGFYNLLEKRLIPDIDISPELILDFNKNYNSITGKELPYLACKLTSGFHAGRIGLIERAKVTERTTESAVFTEPDDALNLRKSEKTSPSA